MPKALDGSAIVWLVAAAMLLWALARHPYGYYVLLRWIVCGVSAYTAFRATEVRKSAWAWIFGIIAFLFNPIIPVHLSRETWAPIDAAVAAILVVSIFVIRRRNDNRIES